MNKIRVSPAVLKALGDGDIENGLIAATPGGIEAQEARGQTILCSNELLPKKMYNIKREEMESLGFRFHDTPNDDPLFVHVSLPEGWTKRPTEHSMWSELVDQEGKVRAKIFYKAAFYDRRADLSWEQEKKGSEL